MMRRLRKIGACTVLIGLVTLASACMAPRSSNRADFQYQPGHSVNPACSQGFRPTNALSCGY